MSSYRSRIRSALLGATALAGATMFATKPAEADAHQFQIDTPAQPLGTALQAFGRASDEQLIFSESLVDGRTAPPLKGSYTVRAGCRCCSRARAWSPTTRPPA